MITCKNCKYRIENTYAKEGYFKLTCGNKWGMTYGQIHDDDFCSRAKLATNEELADRHEENKRYFWG